MSPTHLRVTCGRFGRCAQGCSQYGESARRRCEHGTCERGTGLLSTTIAVLVFLLFMAASVHLLTSMYTRSTVMAVSTDAARSVASRTVLHDDPNEMAAAEAAAERDARHALGRIGDQVRYEWTSTATEVRLQVMLDRPWRLGPGWATMRAFSHLDQTIVMRLERAR